MGAWKRRREKEGFAKTTWGRPVKIPCCKTNQQEHNSLYIMPLSLVISLLCYFQIFNKNSVLCRSFMLELIWWLQKKFPLSICGSSCSPVPERRAAKANEMVKENQESKIVNKAWKINTPPLRDSSTVLWCAVSPWNEDSGWRRNRLDGLGYFGYTHITRKWNAGVPSE